MIRLEYYKTGLADLLDQNKAVKKLYLFGSALTHQFNEKTAISTF